MLLKSLFKLMPIFGMGFAETAFATGDALTQTLWSAKLFREAMGEFFFKKFSGKSDTSIIQTKTDLTKKKGDQITFGLRMKLGGRGVTGSTKIEGNEEALTFYDFSVTVDSLGNAVKAQDKMSLQRPAFDLRGEFKDALKDWLSEIVDIETIEALSASPSTNRVYYGGSATSDATLAVTDTLTSTLISKLKRQAKLATPRLRPVMVDGKENYVLITHPYNLKALRAETAWLNAYRDAGVRGNKNPIFAGGDSYWDGVMVHEYERILTYSTWGSGGDVTGTRSLLLGSQAGVHAYAQYPAWYEKLFDYYRIPGVATDIIYEVAKTVFNSEDFGVIAADTGYQID